jgi:predicted NBD/HSP70 family sugar kinase
MLRTSKVDYRIGVDVGGTKMSAVLLAGERVIGEYTLATPTDDLNKFLVMLGALLEPLFEQAKKDKVVISGIGFGLAGTISENGIADSCNITCLSGTKIGDILRERFGADYKVAVENDANCFALAEARLGAGKKYANVYGLIVGTGIGGGWIYDNRLYRGSHGVANEPGEMVINFSDKLKLEDAYHRLTKNNPKLLADDAYQGDELANQSFAELGEVLGVAIANIVSIIDCEIVVIGGGAVQSSELFMSSLKKSAKELMPGAVGKNLKIAVSKLGKQAGAIGAALLID